MVVTGRCLKSWSSTQATIAMSSREAEYHALVKASAKAIGMKSLAKDFLWDCDVRIWIDATAAKSVASRTRFGKVRHMEAKMKKIRFLKIMAGSIQQMFSQKPASAAEMEGKLSSVGATLQRRYSNEFMPCAKATWADLLDEERAVISKDGGETLCSWI